MIGTLTNVWIYSRQTNDSEKRKVYGTLRNAIVKGSPLERFLLPESDVQRKSLIYNDCTRRNLSGNDDDKNLFEP